MILTKRDVEILNFINDFGFCEIGQIERRFGLKKPRNYQVMKKLVKMGLVKHERIFYGKCGVFYVSRQGSQYTGLPPIKNIPTAIYEHQLMVIELYFKLMHQYPEALWVSERHLVHDKFKIGVGQRGHIPDGMLIMPDHKKIAIELELTLKGEFRLNKILRGYVGQLSIKEVWYFCSSKAFSKVNGAAKAFPFIKVHNLQGLLIPIKND